MDTYTALAITLGYVLRERDLIGRRIVALRGQLAAVDGCARKRCDEPHRPRSIYCSDRCRVLVAGARWQARKRSFGE